jgi:hypothetical protein
MRIIYDRHALASDLTSHEDCGIQRKNFVGSCRVLYICGTTFLKFSPTCTSTDMVSADLEACPRWLALLDWPKWPGVGNILSLTH